ncbi:MULTISPECIES: hypothetical protein [unclassified Streptomyces]|uniref:hypothetical protein n=1 Tax=unclassified Streptomyces TaxID=2593676 RepID=UPI00300949C5
MTAAELGGTAAPTFLGRCRLVAAEPAAAERCFRTAVAAGNRHAAFEAARMRLVPGRDVHGTAAAAGRAAEKGDFFALGSWPGS